MSNNKKRLSVDLDLDNPMDRMVYEYLETPLPNGKNRVKAKWFKALAYDYLLGNLVNGNGTPIIVTKQQSKEEDLSISDIDDDGIIF